MENKRRTGTLCVFLAAVLYSIGGLCIKLIPWGGMAINGARTAIALVVIGATRSGSTAGSRWGR